MPNLTCICLTKTAHVLMPPCMHTLAFPQSIYVSGSTQHSLIIGDKLASGRSDLNLQLLHLPGPFLQLTRLSTTYHSAQVLWCARCSLHMSHTSTACCAVVINSSFHAAGTCRMLPTHHTEGTLGAFQQISGHVSVLRSESDLVSAVNYPRGIATLVRLVQATLKRYTTW